MIVSVISFDCQNVINFLKFFLIMNSSRLNAMFWNPVLQVNEELSQDLKVFYMFFLLLFAFFSSLLRRQCLQHPL